MSGASITFFGGVGTVTGSKALIESDRSSVLLDCGLFQGLSSLRRRNWEPPGFAVRDVDAVVLTHAHLDHSGYLPLLVRHGWHGKVYCTDGTTQLAEVVLRDSAHLQEEEARQANEGGWTKHRPAVPLYDGGDAERACRLLTSVPYGESTEIAEGITLTLGRAGHILGSSWAKLDLDTDTGIRTVVGSGDLGRPSHPLLAPPD
ncbi:MAG: MBL fold metallo-hydrolase, partial [Jatrophihabitantaceae bacterium]